MVPFLVLLSALAAAFFILLYLLYRAAFGRSARRESAEDHIPSQEGYQRWKEPILANIHRIQAEVWEKVSITARDGIHLAGRLSPGGDGAPVVLAFHGYRSNALRDANGGYWYFRERGFRVLLVDQRAHGASGGHAITFGVKERYDCLDWIGYAQRRFGPETPLLLMGVSMGAATVLMASGLNLPPAVRGVIADSSYTSPAAILRKVLEKDLHLPLYPLVRLSARIFGGFDPEAVCAAQGASRAQVPLLLIHGDDDHFVPCSMSREIHTAAPGSTLVVVPGADHGMSFYENNAAYTAAADRLLRQVGL